MKLEQYLTNNDTSHSAFARSLGVSQATVSYWVSGERTPKGSHMALIERETRGAVTFRDWYPRTDVNEPPPVVVAYE